MPAKALCFGTVIRHKTLEQLGIVSHVAATGEITYFRAEGTAVCLRPEVAIQNTDSRCCVDAYREILPYGCWTTKSGLQVLFNRRYHPIWKRVGSAPAEAASSFWVGGIDADKTVYFYDDGSAPRLNKDTLHKCVDVLREWWADKEVKLAQSSVDKLELK